MSDKAEVQSAPAPGEFAFDVFLSYAHADEAAADPPRVPALVEALEAQGVRVRWDRELAAGEDWHARLRGMMTTCRSMVALWSKAALKSEYCIFECTYGSGEPERFLAFDLEPIGAADFQSELLRTVAARSNRDRYDQAAAVAAIVARVKKLREVDKAAALAPLLRSLSEGDAKAYAARISLPAVLREHVPILVGREREETMLLNAWASCAPGADKAQKTDIVVMHALGGAGKTTLLRHMIEQLEAQGFPHAEHVLGWSAYSQGAGNDRNADSETFIIEALRFLGEHGELPKDTVARARLLAARMQKSRTLLLLDGIEPLQSLPEVNLGRLKDKGLAALLADLAMGHPGLVVITSRQYLPELAARKKPGVIDHALERLDARAAAHLLRHLGCWGAQRDFDGAARETDGHALSVALLGTYIANVEGGDLAKRDRLKLGEIIDTLEELGAKDQTGRLAKRAGAIMKGYVERFAALRTESEGEGEAEQLLLFIVGLFNRPADGPAVKALLAEPAIPGLTEAYQSWSPQMRRRRMSLAKNRLRELRLLAAADKADPDQLDAHPVVREHFGKALRAANEETFRAANERLYRHYAAACVKDLPDTLEEMQPLFHAIGHACAAGLHQEAFDEVYYSRVLRQNVKYIVRMLGAYDSELGALAHFFEPPWSVASENLTAPARAAALNSAGFALRALGRMAEAEAPLAAGLAMDVQRKDWKNAAISAGNLSALLLVLGKISAAAEAGAQTVTYADQSGDSAQAMAMRTAHADALAQAGRAAEANALFEDAERRQAEFQPDLPRLYSLQGYRYCDLLLDRGGATNARERAEWLAGLHAQYMQFPLLDRGLNILCDARALALLATHGDATARADAGPRLEEAVAALRKAGTEAHLPRALLARAAHHRQAFAWTGDPTDLKIADQDLRETEDIASRGGMKLFLTDFHLESARLALAQIPGAPPETLVPLDPPLPPLALRAGPPARGDIGAAGKSSPVHGGGGRERSERTEGANLPPLELPDLAARAERRRGFFEMLFGRKSPPRAAEQTNSPPSVAPGPDPGSTPPPISDVGRQEPLTPDEQRLLATAEAHYAEAHRLIEETGYHRRDRERADLRRRLDALI